MLKISKQLTCQKFIYKLHSSRLRKHRWRLTLPIEEARRNEEVISLADSQTLRWIDFLNDITDADAEAKKIKEEIKSLRSAPNNVKNRHAIKKLYEDLDHLQYKPDYVTLIIDKEKDYYRACKGFQINGVKYRRLLGTNGGIKNSTIVFVSEEVSDELHRRITNGRNQEKRLVTAKLEAYQALTCSASTPVSFPKGIAVVNDCETSFLSDIVHLTDECDGEPIMELKEKQKVDLDASDGFGMMLPSLAERWSNELGLDYTISGANTRFSFEKGMAFTFDYVDFADKVADGKYIIKDAWGNDFDIRDVELILTTSMVKLWDSYDSCEDYVKNSLSNGYTFGIAKTCPKELESEHSLNYQFIQSYDLSDDEIEELIAPTMNEIKDADTDFIVDGYTVDYSTLDAHRADLLAAALDYAKKADPQAYVNDADGIKALIAADNDLLLTIVAAQYEADKATAVSILNGISVSDFSTAEMKYACKEDGHTCKTYQDHVKAILADAVEAINEATFTSDSKVADYVAAKGVIDRYFDDYAGEIAYTKLLKEKGYVGTTNIGLGIYEINEDYVDTYVDADKVTRTYKLSAYTTEYVNGQNAVTAADVADADDVE